jgi:long-chain acyl-CoA synthetase
LATHFSGILTGPESTGLACLVNDIKIVNDKGETLPPRGIGEVYVKGVNRANGYWKNPEATAAAFLKDGYYRTYVLISSRHR